MPTRRYTEEEFRTAVADPNVRTMADLCRALGLVPRGANYQTLRSYGAELDLDIDHELDWRRLDRTDEELARAAAHATSITDVLLCLGLPHHDRAHMTVRDRLAELGIPHVGTLHPTSVVRPRSRNQRSYSDQDLLRALADPKIDGYRALCEALGLRPLTNTYSRLRHRARALGSPIPAGWSRTGTRTDGNTRSRRHDLPSREALFTAVADARSLADTIRALGRDPTAAAYAWVKAAIAFYKVDTSHFRPYSRIQQSRARPLEEVLVYGCEYSSVQLRRRLIAEGLKEHRCEDCGNTRWNGQPIPLELDHIDGDRLNNLLVNLRLLCPNCHALTPTYRGRNIGRANGSARSAHYVTTETVPEGDE